MKAMVQKKKEEYWKKFTEEYGERDPWEVARLARDLWRLRMSMRKLVEEEGGSLEEDEEKAAALSSVTVTLAMTRFTPGSADYDYDDDDDRCRVC